MQVRSYRKTRRQQLGKPDRWRLLEKLDPSMMVIIPDYCCVGSEKPSVWRRLVIVRRSQIEELKKQYGDDMEVI